MGGGEKAIFRQEWTKLGRSRGKDRGGGGRSEMVRRVGEGGEGKAKGD